jgi:ubiquinol-cytochrome c reductase cytochrome b subunit
LMAIVFLMPFIGRSQIGHNLNRAFLVVLLAGVGYLTWITIEEDAHNDSHQAKLRFAERDAERVVELAEREGIPQNGARELLVHDPFTQGPRLFARHCSSCHRFDGHDGTGQKILKTVEVDGKKTIVPEPDTAADLKDFGSREWVRRVLTEYGSTFKPLENAGEKGKRFLEGEMAGWCNDNQKLLSDPANAESLNSLVEFLAAQSGRTDGKMFDEKLVAAGKEIFKSGALTSGKLSSSCADCHAMQAAGDTQSLGDGAGPGYPKLTGYAGREWMKSFLRDPGHADFYGENNLMLAFDAKRLSDDELDLLVNWMTGQYYRPAQSHE